MPPKTNKSGNAASSQSRPAASSTPPPSGGTTSQPTVDTPRPISLKEPLTEADATAIKSGLLFELREEIKVMFKAELQLALGENLASVKSELFSLKTQISSEITTMKQDFAGMKNTVSDMEHSLTSCTDDITSLRSQMDNMAKELVKLENRCEDLESRSRRSNVRIVGVPENHIPSSDFVSNLLMEAFTLTKPPLVDRAHRTLAPKPGPNERPRAIVAKLHYYSDCAIILQKARELQRVRIRDMTISIFPDHTAKVARARAAFNEARRELRGIEGVRFGILHPGKLRITYRGVQRDFTSPGEAKVYIKTMTEPPSPEGQ